MANWLQNLTAR